MINLLFHRPCASAVDSGGQTAPALDAGALARLHELDPDGRRGFVAQVLKTYEVSMERQLARLRDAMAAGDARSAAEVAHTLKSSSASVGALDFVQHCLALERAAKSDAGAELASLASSLQSEGRRVLATVQAMLQAEGR